tara:strand:- start:615 stop:791 length:177 start_codon:yes stop_codon:yes gene_type:complete
MNKSLTASEVLELIQTKIALKKKLRNAKKSKQVDESKILSKKIEKIEDKLTSRPLSKV